jgi:AmpD protein
MNIFNHRLDKARQLPSPNYDVRPDPADISLLVIHCISLPPEEFGGDYIEQLFTNGLDPDDHPYFQAISGLKVSAHLLIRREGEIVQFVDFNHCAWHAGVSFFETRERCNDFSIGIELEGSVNQTYTEAQYLQLIDITLLLLKHYPKLSPNRIVGHSDIAPGRKQDPGPGFDWLRYLGALSY